MARNLPVDSTTFPNECTLIYLEQLKDYLFLKMLSNKNDFADFITIKQVNID